MKKIKIFVAMLTAMVLASSLAASLVACGKSAQNEEYKYADNWEIPADITEKPVTEEGLAEIYPYTEEVDLDYSSPNYQRYWGIAWDALNGCSYLYWDNYGIKNNILVLRNRDNCPPKAKDIVDRFGSYYDTNTGEVILLRNFSDEERDYFIVRALIQSVFSAEHERTISYLEEGVIAYYAAKAAEEEGWYYTTGYSREEMYTAQILISLYGEEEVLKAASEDRLTELVDNATKKGMGEKLEASFNLGYAWNPGYTDYYPVRYDILGHMLMSIKDDSVRNDLKEKIRLEMINMSTDLASDEYLLKLFE